VAAWALLEDLVDKSIDWEQIDQVNGNKNERGLHVISSSTAMDAKLNLINKRLDAIEGKGK
jgi:delta-aminolevulinic acid dehydratase/porphobilinogen synthase